MEKMGKPSLLPIFDGSWKEAIKEGQKAESKSILDKIKR
jgi:hypothetical protein